MPSVAAVLDMTVWYPEIFKWNSSHPGFMPLNGSHVTDLFAYARQKALRHKPCSHLQEQKHSAISSVHNALVEGDSLA